MVNKKCKNYLQSEVLSATKDKIIQLVYDKVLTTLNLAVKNLEENNIVEVHNNIIKAEMIIFHLMNHLDFKAGEISKNLFNIYEYSLNQLKDANVKKDIEMVKNVINIFKELNEAWKHINVKNVKGKESKENEALNYSV
jgi:flagellar protein FliS